MRCILILCIQYALLGTLFSQDYTILLALGKKSVAIMMRPLPTYLIYIVEDNQDDQVLFRLALKRQVVGCHLRFFTHGAELLTQLTHLLDGRLPDVIFLDLDMPLMNGFDTLQLLKNTPEYIPIPVVIRSGHHTPEDINRCYALGCQAYLTKTYPDLTLSRLMGQLTETSASK